MPKFAVVFVAEMSFKNLLPHLVNRFQVCRRCSKVVRKVVIIPAVLVWNGPNLFLNEMSLKTIKPGFGYVCRCE